MLSTRDVLYLQPTTACLSAIDYTAWANAVFGTMPIPLGVWLFIIPFALGIVALRRAGQMVGALAREPTGHNDLIWHAKDSDDLSQRKGA